MPRYYQSQLLAKQSLDLSFQKKTENKANQNDKKDIKLFEKLRFRNRLPVDLIYFLQIQMSGRPESFFYSYSFGLRPN